MTKNANGDTITTIGNRKEETSMTQFTHTNKKGTWNLWQDNVRLASGKSVTVQYFLQAGKTPRSKTTQAAKEIKPGYEIHEIGKSKTPVVSKIVTKEGSK